MVSVDTVYQRVLALANKEQRGYITPQEFNLYANQAQMEIFEQYFYDSNQFGRVPGNDSEYHDMVDLIDEKLYPFKKSDAVSTGDSGDSYYRLGDVYALESGYSPANTDPFSKSVVVEEIRQGDLIKTQNSPLTRATNNRPIYYIQSGKMYFFPETAPSGWKYRAFYIQKPAKANWTYVVVDEKPLYNSSAIDHQNFELHISEESKLVIKILQLAGVGIKDLNLAQIAGKKEASVKQQEKQ